MELPCGSSSLVTAASTCSAPRASVWFTTQQQMARARCTSPDLLLMPGKVDAVLARRDATGMAGRLRRKPDLLRWQQTATKFLAKYARTDRKLLRQGGVRITLRKT